MGTWELFFKRPPWSKSTIAFRHLGITWSICTHFSQICLRYPQVVFGANIGHGSTMCMPDIPNILDGFKTKMTNSMGPWPMVPDFWHRPIFDPLHAKKATWFCKQKWDVPFSGLLAVHPWSPLTHDINSGCEEIPHFSEMFNRTCTPGATEPQPDRKLGTLTCFFPT